MEGRAEHVEVDPLFDPSQTPVCKMLTRERTAFNEISGQISQSSFPCLFARKAWRAGSIRYAFCDVNVEQGFLRALNALIEYTEFVKEVPIHQRIYQPLVIVLMESDCVPDKQHSLGWCALRWFHERDPMSWPANVPKDPDDPEWSFCFNGVPLFVNMSSAAHVQLRNRNLGSHLVLVVNPRGNFDAVASLKSRQGRAVRKRIRERVEAFNQMDVPSALGFYGDPDNREWKQYQLAEQGLPAPESCPLIIRDGKGAR